ncbi:hypothetical protein [Halorubrum amylolyticum]|uniref:hypothetical protein n=1 Tax=Halorubrum amylolyticum TaxID=2508724 RepID=UPI001008A721|nr:hypothetical protein [Halorubrum amylolyticum]
MVQPRSRRQFLAATVPLTLAGCLVEGGTDTPNNGVEATSSEQPTGRKQRAKSDTDEVRAQSSGSEKTTNASTDDRDRYPKPTGITIEETDIVRIVESIHLSQIIADVVVGNPGENTYGTLELRIDAYYEPPTDDRTYHPPRVDERIAVGRTYVDQTFESFGSGIRTFEDAMIQYDDDETNNSVNTANFDLEVAVRRAEPL